MPDPVFVGDYSFYAKVAAIDAEHKRAVDLLMNVHRVTIDGIDIPLIVDASIPPGEIWLVATKAPSDFDIVRCVNCKE